MSETQVLYKMDMSDTLNSYFLMHNFNLQMSTVGDWYIFIVNGT